jgi:hypothetical protein
LKEVNKIDSSTCRLKPDLNKIFHPLSFVFFPVFAKLLENIYLINKEEEEKSDNILSKKN